MKNKKYPFLFFLIVLLSTGIGWAQNEKITLHLDNVSLEHVLNKIEEKTAYSFQYSKQVIDVRQKRTIHVDKQAIHNVLETLLKGTSIQYQIKNRQIILSAKKTVKTNTKMLKGIIKDRKTGEPIIGASIAVEKESIGAISDINGNFAINVSADKKIVVSYIGYESQVLDVLDKNGMAYELYSNIKPNPTIENVQTGVQAFKDAGIEAPETMDEFINAAKKLAGTNANGQQVWGYDEPALAGWNLCPFIWSMGGSITNEDETKASGYINSPETVKAIETLAELYQAGAITGWNAGDIPMTDGFGTGRYMMLLEGPWKVAEMQGSYPDFEYATTEMPAGDAGSISVLGGEDIAMFNSANKDAAWKFIKFMTSEFAEEEMAKCGQIPVNKEALESDTVKAADYAPFLEAIKTAKSRPTVACWSEMDSELSVAVTDVMNGKKTAQEAMDKLAERFDELLAE